MNISSVQPTCSITSSNSIDTITLNSTITTGATGSSYYTIGSGVGGLSGSTITITNGGGLTGAVGAGSGYTWKSPEEFVDSFPDYYRIQQMCKTYPGLKIAYEKFVTTYRLVKDDYDNPNIEK